MGPAEEGSPFSCEASIHPRSTRRSKLTNNGLPAKAEIEE
jgi:hypothetical protein